MAVEMLKPKGFGRIRLRRIANDSGACVIPFMQEVVVPGAQVRTDGSVQPEHWTPIWMGSCSASIAAHPNRAACFSIDYCNKRS